MSKYLEDRVSELELRWKQPSPWAKDSDLDNVIRKIDDLHKRFSRIEESKHAFHGVLELQNDIERLQAMQNILTTQVVKLLDERKINTQPEPCADKPSDKEETILCGRCYKRLCTYTYTSVVAHKDWMPVCIECLGKVVAR